MALAFADRVIQESANRDDESRIDYAVRLTLARSATQKEKQILKQLLVSERDSISGDPKTIEARTKKPFPSMKLNTTDKTELAVWFAMANALLNLDETISQ